MKTLPLFLVLEWTNQILVFCNFHIYNTKNDLIIQIVFVYVCRFYFASMLTIIRSDLGFVPTIRYNNITVIHYRTLCCACSILLNCKLPRDKQKKRILWVTLSKSDVIHSFCKYRLLIITNFLIASNYRTFLRQTY